MNHVLFFGFGYSARALALMLDSKVWRVTGTSRSDEGLAQIAGLGFDGVRFDALDEIPPSVTHIVSSVPPDATGDPVLRKFAAELARKAQGFTWVGYLSTTGVYGDHAGHWVDETALPTPNTERGWRRLVAENNWRELHANHGLPLHIFRLAGIYGPGRNQLQSVLDGSAKRVIKPGQIFSRVHIDDIAGILLASMANPNPGRVYNVADDEPGPPQDVVLYAAQLLGRAPPPAISFDDAALSPMARSFYADSKRVSNARIKAELGYRLKFPNYRDGLKALLPSLGALPGSMQSSSRKGVAPD